MDVPQPPIGGVGPLLASERRASPRYPYQRKTLCQPCQHSLHAPTGSVDSGVDPTAPDCPAPTVIKADDIWLMGMSQDLSAGGIGFILHRPFDPGTLLTVELQRPQRNSWGQLPARVLNATFQPDGNWRLGCALTRVLSEEELRSWINGQHAKVSPPR